MKKALLYGFALALALLLCACSSAPKATAGPSPSPSAVPTQSPGPGSEASATPGLTVVEIDGWPEEIPAYVPRFEAGAFAPEGSSRAEAGGVVTFGIAFTGVARQDVDAYLDAMKRAGFEAYPSEADGIYAVAGTVTKSGEKSVMASASLEEESGKCIVHIMLTQTGG